MARTIHGHLTGRARATELREQREQLREQEEAGRKRQEAEQIEAENDAIRRCIALEGEWSFWRWHDNDANVPAHGPRAERIRLIEERIQGIEKHHASVLAENSDEEKSQEKAGS